MGKKASLQIEIASKLDTEESKMLLKGSKKPDFDNSGSLPVDKFLTYQNYSKTLWVMNIFDKDGR